MKIIEIYDLHPLFGMTRYFSTRSKCINIWWGRLFFVNLRLKWLLCRPRVEA